MLTICIPVYNTDVTKLVNDLLKQSEEQSLAVEIILIDDSSSEKYKKLNDGVCKKVKCISLEKNIGRAKIRNLFLNYARFEYLLFIDNDSVIIGDNYLSKYLEILNQETCSVVCGGRIYDKDPPARTKRLRWKYGIEKESQPYHVRQLYPYKSFMTNNFLIYREILKEVRFDERLTEYGHEDTLFGYNLKKKGVKINHIDNPVLNGVLEDNAEYLLKTETGIISLIQALSYVDYDSGFINDITILKFHKKLSSMHLTVAIFFIFILTKPILRFMLIKGIVSLFLFNFYKLGVFMQHYKNNYDLKS